MSLTDELLPAFLARAVLLANHALSSSRVAPLKLRPHAGKVLSIEMEAWPLGPPFPAPPPMWLRVTRAGLVEAVSPDEVNRATPDLQVRINAAEPFRAAERLLAGALPPLAIEGDAGLATDVNWVIANVRWDLAADVHRFFGPVAAAGVERIGSGVGALLKTWQAHREAAARTHDAP